ncbi:MAG: hypothetical protein QOJ50_1841 [Cryptosporangiaceae bacterium]|nr:hypothetical protein [Cryptosporangiaceae bacterium]
MADLTGATSALQSPPPPPGGPAHGGPRKSWWPLGRRATIAAGAAVVVVVAGGTAYSLNSADDAGALKSVPASLSPVEDTFVNAAAPTRTNGAQTKLAVGSEAAGAKTTYLLFSVPAVAAGHHASGAALTLTRESGAFPATTVSLHSVADTGWSQSTLNAKSAPEPGAVVGTADLVPGGNTVRFDLSGVVTAGGRYAFALTAPVDGVARFRSSEAGAGGPALTYVVADGSAIAAPGRVPQQSAPASPGASASGQPSPSASGSTGASSPGGAGCGVSAILVPGCGRWLGAAPLAQTDVPRPQALADYEQRLGAPVDIMHLYHSGGQLFPTPAEIKMASEPGRNRHLLVNWKPTGKWADIAAGKDDAEIDRLAAHITTAFPDKFFLAIFHEPEDNVVDKAGSKMRASDFRAMFRHVVQRLRSKGVTNAVTVMNYMGASKWGATSWFGDLYPGDDVVDWIAFDPYAMGQPGFHHGDFAAMVNRGQGAKWPGMYDWIASNHPGKPVMLGEWGFGDYAQDRSAKANFFSSLGSELDRFPAIKALVYFDSPDAAPFGDTRINSSGQALSAFKAMAGAAQIAKAPAPRLTR